MGGGRWGQKNTLSAPETHCQIVEEFAEDENLNRFQKQQLLDIFRDDCIIRHL